MREQPRRPAARLAALLLLLALINTVIWFHGQQIRQRQQQALPKLHIVTAALGLTDLAVATEARYTRHPAVSDPLAAFMDHPGAIEHFPTGSFWAPPPLLREPHPSAAALRRRPNGEGS
ncbi:MAG: hypothetical protein U5J62_02645 [Desulfurivibrio sp.]|nr:hypothetical protein [Desulfurivibrio sp.]